MKTLLASVDPNAAPPTTSGVQWLGIALITGGGAAVASASITEFTGGGLIRKDTTPWMVGGLIAIVAGYFMARK